MATYNDIISYVDEVKPNQYDDDLKVIWLSNLDKRILNDIIATHELLEGETVPELGTDISTECIVGEPYTDLYKYYVMANIDFANNETDRYMNSMIMFNNAYTEFGNYYNRTHRPKYKSLHL